MQLGHKKNLVAILIFEVSIPIEPALLVALLARISHQPAVKERDSCAMTYLNFDALRSPAVFN